MQLSKFTDYSFRALIYLADKKGSLATVEELANALQISEHHLKKIIHKLAKTNYVISIKGRGGGLKLGMDPKDINLGEILKITEDNMSTSPRHRPRPSAPRLSARPPRRPRERPRRLLWPLPSMPPLTSWLSSSRTARA